MRDAIGLRAPEDLALVGGRLLYDEVERKVGEVGRRLDPSLSSDAGGLVRRQLEHLTALSIDIDPREKLPAWTRDPADDCVVEMAFRADAAAIISRDSDLVPSGRRHAWIDPGRSARVEAYWQSEFIDQYVNNSGFHIDDVNPDLLRLAILA